MPASHERSAPRSRSQECTGTTSDGRRRARMSVGRHRRGRRVVDYRTCLGSKRQHSENMFYSHKDCEQCGMPANTFYSLMLREAIEERAEDDGESLVRGFDGEIAAQSTDGGGTLVQDGY